MSFKEGNNRRSRLVKEAKALQKKARRNGGELHGNDLARLRSVSGRLVKSTYFNDSENSDDS